MGFGGEGGSDVGFSLHMEFRTLGALCGLGLLSLIWEFPKIKGELSLGSE